MAIGFSDRFDFGPIIGGELYQVTIDKYHVMFRFENEHCPLNVADRFSFIKNIPSPIGLPPNPRVDLAAIPALPDR